MSQRLLAIEMQDVVKEYGAPRPLCLRAFTVMTGERYVLSGFDSGAAEMFVNLVTGAALPETGTVRVAGRDTREIATDTEWLASLDRFGLVTDRAVLIDALPVASNMALPLTLRIDPLEDDVRTAVEQLGDAVGLAPARLSAAASTLTPAERVRVHLARALATGPEMLLLEHPTRTLGDSPASAALGETLRRLSDARRLGWIALSEDDQFARAAGGTCLALNATTGVLSRAGFWRTLWSRS